MEDVIRFPVRDFENNRQFRAASEMYDYLSKRRMEPDRNFDCSIRPKTGVLFLDMRKHYSMDEVVDFFSFAYRAAPSANCP